MQGYKALHTEIVSRHPNVIRRTAHQWLLLPPISIAVAIPLHHVSITCVRERIYRSTTTATSTPVSTSCGSDVLGLIGLRTADTGGISTFSAKDASWPANKTWVLQKGTQLVTGLQAHKDRGTHWSIEPATVMKFTAYKSHLTQLNSKAVRYDSLQKDVVADDEAEARVLKAQSAHHDRATRFVYDVFVAVVQTRTPVSGWDENDYTYLTELAHALEDGTLPLSALIWDEDAGWSKEKVFAADAVAAHIAKESTRVLKLGDEDEQADANNDHAYLRAVLKLDDAKNPFVA